MNQSSVGCPWGEHKFTSDEIVEISIGTLRLWWQLRDSELWLAYKHIGENSNADSAEKKEEDNKGIPEDLDWLRWSIGKHECKFRVSPVLPDRPVIVKPEASFRLIKGSSSRIFVRIPVWLRIENMDKPDKPIIEIPTVVLSDTWFGSFTGGELCYWISSSARSQVEADPERNYLTICPIKITNGSDEDLVVEKICIRAAGLSLFFEGNQLWSDEVSLTYRGTDNVSRINFSGKSPDECNNAQIISQPRQPVHRGLVAKSFATLKELPGFGYIMD